MRSIKIKSLEDISQRTAQYEFKAEIFRQALNPLEDGTLPCLSDQQARELNELIKEIKRFKKACITFWLMKANFSNKQVAAATGLTASRVSQICASTILKKRNKHAR